MHPAYGRPEYATLVEQFRHPGRMRSAIFGPDGDGYSPGAMTVRVRKCGTLRPHENTHDLDRTRRWIGTVFQSDGRRVAMIDQSQMSSGRATAAPLPR